MGVLPMTYGLGRTHMARGEADGLTLVTLIRGDHRYPFHGIHQPSKLARLFLQALAALNAQTPQRDTMC
jgi:hypothetical protein